MITCEICGQENLASYPRDNERQLYSYIDGDAVEDRGSMYDEIFLCYDCWNCISDRNWEEIANRTRVRKERGTHGKTN